VEETELEVMSGARSPRVVLGVIAALAAITAAGSSDAADTQQSTDAVGGFLSALGKSLGGAQQHDPVDFHTLVSLLPPSLKGMQRGTPQGSANQAMGIKTTSAEVDFQGANDARINVSIKDATAFSGIAGLAEMANGTESEQGNNYEKNATVGGRNVHEKWSAADKHGELSLILVQRFGVDITGDGVGMDALERALAGIDLGKLESMKDANPRAQ
jgi:type II secretory pathway pseudopilin PulG